MKVDLHSHTYPASQCSNMSVENLIVRAKEIGIDAMCLTEHNKPWNRDDILRLSENFDFRVLRGMEVTTKDGDILVFGLHEEMRDILTASELRERVADVGGFTIAAHPFRGFLMVGYLNLSLTPERAAGRAVFRSVDAIEAYNCKVTQHETDLALDVGARLDLPCVAGSDAHTLADVGKYVTYFEREISTEEELIAELKAGRFRIDA
ncbi:MAG: PHP domain-containing protein [Candidatus Abyssobacteria bacterium SURF_17]|uniref:PHP domain-containing protein n=1 Tax=Candidatus Abyssobacteria bacterium SURF_17 TaxID=2093361 RepID=A0A419F9J9_9BACT|nr:MAG: PHP domain-containing protein [Candidatus Abyssubacteria bacterium SURF_17]